MDSYNPKSALKIAIASTISRHHCALRLTPNRDAMSILVRLATDPAIHPDARPFLWNAAFCVCGVSNMSRPPVPGYEIEPGELKPLPL